MPLNPGHLPEECIIRDDDGEVTGYRQVMVTLFNGRTIGPWPAAGGRPYPTNWKISRPPHRYEIKEYQIA